MREGMKAEEGMAGLESAAAEWRGSGLPADFIRAAERLTAGTEAARVRALLGAPRLVTPLPDGGESWLYVPNDPARGRFEALFLAIDPSGRFARLDRKPID